LIKVYKPLAKLHLNLFTISFESNPAHPRPRFHPTLHPKLQKGVHKLLFPQEECY